MDLNGEDYVRSIQQQLGILGTVSEFACRLRKTKKSGVEMDARRTFRVHTDLRPAVRQKQHGNPPLTRVLLLQANTD
jgi:hypothetical protein